MTGAPQGPHQQRNDKRCGNGYGPNAVCLNLRGVVYGYHGRASSGEFYARHARFYTSRHAIYLLNELCIAVCFACPVWRCKHGHGVAVVGCKDVAVV